MNNKNLKILFFKKDAIDKNEIMEPKTVEPKNNETIITTFLKENLINTNTKTNIDTIDEHLNNTLLISSLIKISSQQTISNKNNSDSTENVDNKLENTVENVDNELENNVDNKLENIVENVDNNLENSVENVDNNIGKTVENADNKIGKTVENVDNKIGKTVENVNNKVEKTNKNQELIDALLIRIEEKFELEKNKKLEELEQIKNDLIIKSDTDKYLLKNYIKLKLENSKIPLVIYQTWITKVVPEKMAKTIEKIKNANPEFEHKLFDDTDCRNFIINNFNENVLYAYDNLIPGAFKADLWRYCVLYIHGGIYVDIKYEPINDFKFIDLIDKDYFVLDRASHFKGHIGIYNALLISQPNNPIFLKLIKAIIDNVKNKNYGINALSVTGPSLVGRILYPNNNKYTALIEKEYDLKYANDGLGIEYKGKKILIQYTEYRRDQTKYTKTSYQNLWDNKKIFKK